MRRPPRPGTPAENAPGVGEPPLRGTEWQLAAYRDPGAEPVEVTTDSTLRFSKDGKFSAHACNYYGGSARVTGGEVAFADLGGTLKACSGEEAQLERRVTATLQGTRTWAISDRKLVIGGDGRELTYRVRSSIYPDQDARTIVKGDRAGGQWRLSVSGTGERLWLGFESRTGPGEGWGQSGVASPGKGDCLAGNVMPAGVLGGQTFVTAWATPDVAKVTTRVDRTAPELTLAFYRVPGSTLRVAGLWVTGFRPSGSAVTFYDRAGRVITAYPNGPC